MNIFELFIISISDIKKDAYMCMITLYMSLIIIEGYPLFPTCHFHTEDNMRDTSANAVPIRFFS